jgi:hypothetical protein
LQIIAPTSRSGTKFGPGYREVNTGRAIPMTCPADRFSWFAFLTPCGAVRIKINAGDDFSHRLSGCSFAAGIANSLPGQCLRQSSLLEYIGPHRPF